MKKVKLIDKYLALNPLIKGRLEIGIIILSGIISVGFDFCRIPPFPIINIIGGFLVLVSIILHFYCEKYHKAAHSDTKDINKIVTTGIYSKLRHPIYLSLILMYIGIGLIFNSWISIFFALILSPSWGFIALKEEKELTCKFREDYEKYKKNVRWRIIPGIF